MLRTASNTKKSHVHLRADNIHNVFKFLTVQIIAIYMFADDNDADQ